jgi:hypothetical protein
LKKVSKYDLDRNEVDFKSLHKEKAMDRTANIKLLKTEMDLESHHKVVISAL